MRLSLLLASLLAAGPLLAQDAGPARRSLEAFSAGLETFYATFSQTITTQDGRVESEGEGEVWLARPALFRWAYQGEFPELIVADGERVWLFDEVLEQVTVKSQSGLAADSPLMLLTDLSALDERFRVTEAGDFEDMHMLELVSLSAESEFDRVLLGLAADGVRLMAMEDAFGMRTEIRFDAVARNPGLSPELFEFLPPPHVDVVGDLEPEPEPEP